MGQSPSEEVDASKKSRWIPPSAHILGVAMAPLPFASSRSSSRLRLPRLLLCLLAAGSLSALACGQLASDSTGADDDADDDGPLRPGRDGGRDAGPRRPDGGRTGPGPGPDASNDYVEPECPERPAPDEVYECDPFAQTGCEAGEACSPFVQYPSDPCGAETYGAFCIPAGTLTQGESCESQLDCAAGYLCLITGAGTTCGKTCDLADSDACTDGLVCVSTDVAGIGACF